MIDIITSPVFAVIFLLGALIFFHELGHYLVGRWCGIGVETFSIGMGPTIVAFERKGTVYRIGLLPLGGYVKFHGSHFEMSGPDQSGDEKTRVVEGIEFQNAPLISRMATIAAGPLANFILAVLIYMALVMNGIPHRPAVVGELRSGSAADQAGILIGDQILEIDGKRVKTFTDIEKVVSKIVDRTVTIRVLREGSEFSTQMTPVATEVTTIDRTTEKRGMIGVSYLMLPSILDIRNSNSPLAKIGVKTGYRMLSLAGASSNCGGQTEYYRDFLTKLATCWQKGEQSVTLEFARSIGPGKVEIIGNKKQAVLKLPNKKPFSNTDSSIVIHEKLEKYFHISDAQLVLFEGKGDLADKIVPGDRLTHYAGTKINDMFHLRDVAVKNEKQVVSISVIRSGVPRTFDVKLKQNEVQRPEGKIIHYNFEGVFWGQPILPEPYIEKRTNVFSALLFGMDQTIEKIRLISDSLFGMISGDVPLKALGGPIMIASVAGETAKLGFTAFFSMMAVISVNLGLINLFPIPVLDGGQLLVYSLEAIRRKPLSVEAIENFQRVGFVLVLSLIVMAFYNDLSRYWSSIARSVIGGS